MDLTKIFVDVDDFMKNYLCSAPKKLTLNKTQKISRNRACRLSNSEVMTICITFHISGYRNFKAFYLEYVCKYLSCYFPKLVSYNRFVELMKENNEYLCAYLNSRLEPSTGINYIDSTPIQVCKTKRISRNKVFSELAKLGKTTIGWFFGFKLHIIVNDKGGLVAVHLTQGNIDDRKPVPIMAKKIFGKLFGDKGYLSKKLSTELLDRGIHLFTGIKKKMKNKLMPIYDKILLRKRSIIETINDQLKNISQVEHSRHRNPDNFIVNLLCGLIAYTHQPKKPSIKGCNMKLIEAF